MIIFSNSFPDPARGVSSAKLNMHVQFPQLDLVHVTSWADECTRVSVISLHLILVHDLVRKADIGR